MEQMQLDENRIVAVLEPLRKKWNFFTILIVLDGLVMVAGTLIMMFVFPDVLIKIGVMFGVIFVLGIIMAFVMIVLDYKAAKEYANTYKQMISKYVLQDYFEEVSYKPLKGFTAEEFRAGHLINWRSDFSFDSEDLIEGRYEGVAFKQSDVKITHETGRGKNRHTVVDVNGRLTRFQYEKAIDERILIVTDLHSAGLETGLSKVEMEDVEFNRKFDVYSSDAHSVYYLLTPHFMEYLKKLRSLDIMLYISFDGQRLYFLRSGKGGIFEPPRRQINVKAEVERNRRELDEIKKLIEVLKLV